MKGDCSPTVDFEKECRMSLTGRLSTAVGLFLVAVGLIVWSLLAFLHPGTDGGYTDYTMGHTRVRR